MKQYERRSIGEFDYFMFSLDNSNMWRHYSDSGWIKTHCTRKRYYCQLESCKCIHLYMYVYLCVACGSIKANDEALANMPTKSVNDINEPEISDEILETNFVDVNSLDSYEDESSCSDTEMQKMTHEKQESRKVVKGNVTARPTIVSQVIIRPSTNSDGINVLNMIQNKENVGNNSILPSTSNDDIIVLNIIQNKENIENNEDINVRRQFVSILSH